MAKALVGNVGSYIFNAAAKTITLTGLPTLPIENILVITNTKNTANEVIYDFSDANKGGTIAGNVITLVFDTTSMSNSDPLQIWVELSSANNPATLSKIEGDVTGNVAEVSSDSQLRITDKDLFTNHNNTISANLNLTANKNHYSSGLVIVTDDVTVTIPSDSAWFIN